ncbi:hypothetical protein DRE_04559 [Drechslerella stenobrocha 248]|uniref:SWIM-type domain-containing protein n=1 Tax=Drechslerella stenobrocha 248 TaxID=1043628 RepID=W7HPV9_9PEZI|nr:hypothetical protein DRE_04559 [Drechslerella stenobrocha 248]
MASPSSSRRLRHASPFKLLEGRAATYNNEHLTREQWTWACNGIRKSSYNVNCKEGKYFSFNLVPSYHPEDTPMESRMVKVSIGPESSKYKYPSCTCPDHLYRKQACLHIFWVLDNVLDYTSLRPDGPEGSFSLRKDGHCFPSHTGPYNYLKSTGIAGIAHAKGWTFSGPDQWSIPAQVRDMIRHFDQSPNSQSSQHSDEYLSSSTSLSGAVYRLALSKPQFFADLRQEAPVEICTKSYLRNLDRDISYTFQRWINYTKTGKPHLDYMDHNTHPDNLRAPNVVWISNKLRQFVYEIEIALYQRGPVDFDNKRSAFKLLMMMFERVIAMDMNTPDFHYRPRGAEIIQETERERNLYTRLIRHHSEGYDNFAISAMRRIPEAGVDFLQTLYDHRQYIRETASREYAEEFDALCREIDEMSL